MAELMRLPRKFFDDHRWRELPTPEIHRETKRHVWIAPDDPALPELLDDARFYADPGIAADMEMRGLAASARATVRALENANEEER